MAQKKHHITAVIYDKRGKVLSVGQNSFIKTHPLQAFHANKVNLPEKQYLHAEVAALVKCRDLSKAHSIFVARYSADGVPVLAKPCAICMSALRAAGIKIINHT